MESERELAFIAVHRDSYPRVYRFVRRRVESTELAEELAADVFRVVWQIWGDPPRTDIAWMFTVARNLIGNAYRIRDGLLALKTKLRASAELCSGTESEDLVVHDALAALRDSDCDILQMAYWDELSNAEIVHFQHPAIWRVTETIESTVSDLRYWNRTIRVKDASGKLLSSLHIAPDAAGGSCTPVPYQTLDPVTLDIPQRPTSSPYVGPTQFKYRVMEGAQVFGALTIDSSSVAPVGTACLLLSAIQPPQNVPAVSFGMGAFLEAEGKGGGEGAAAQKSFASVAEAKAYMDTPEYRDIKRGGKASFNLPLGWTAKDVPVDSPDYPGSAIRVTDETGKTVANFHHGATGGLGSACARNYPITELDTATTSLNAQWPTSAVVRFSYRVRDQTSVGKGLSYQVGLVDKDSGQVQDTLLMYKVVTGTPRGILSFADRAVQDAAEPRFASMAEARAYMETPEYRKLKAMIRSLEINS